MVSLCALFAFLHLIGINDRIFYAASSMAHKETRNNNEVGLNDYVLAASHSIPCLERNLSGITYCHQSKTLFAVTNNPPKVYEISTAGICVREIPLIGFNDTEGIVFLGGKKFAIIEEREHSLNIVEIDNKTTILDRSNILSSLQVDMKEKDNRGFEGIAYDDVKQCFYVVNEKRPIQIITISGLLHNKEAIKISIQPDLLPSKFFMGDLSGLHFDSVSRHLLFLSEESKLVSQVSLEGETISYLELEKGFAGLKDDISQPEGITMDNAGNIYIVSEPNLFYRFVRTEGI
jgi:uncharacterized protein YjiK